MVVDLYTPVEVRMSAFVDFNDLKERVSLLDTVGLLGLELTKRGETYRGK